MVITENTKISELIKANEKAIDAIASINKHFEKLRNPILRKILASRVTIADAAKIGNSSVDVFFQKLAQLGFTVNTNEKTETPERQIDRRLWQQMESKTVMEMDVRSQIASNLDPFNDIYNSVNKLQANQVFKLINSFEPIPLIKLLRQKGYICEVKKQNDVIVTLIMKTDAVQSTIESATTHEDMDFDKTAARYRNCTITIDVREMEMPKPMISILEECSKLQSGRALYVKHKRVPQFLFPELAALNFQWKLKKMDEDNVHLIIYKND